MGTAMAAWCPAPRPQLTGIVRRIGRKSLARTLGPTVFQLFGLNGETAAISILEHGVRTMLTHGRNGEIGSLGRGLGFRPRESSPFCTCLRLAERGKDSMSGSPWTRVRAQFISEDSSCRSARRCSGDRERQTPARHHHASIRAVLHDDDDIRGPGSAQEH